MVLHGIKVFFSDFLSRKIIKVLKKSANILILYNLSINIFQIKKETFLMIPRYFDIKIHQV